MCQGCGDSFVHNLDLWEHQAYKHRGRKKHVSCPKCPMIFYNTNLFKEHLQTHANLSWLDSRQVLIAELPNFFCLNYSHFYKIIGSCVNTMVDRIDVKMSRVNKLLSVIHSANPTSTYCLYTPTILLLSTTPSLLSITSTILLPAEHQTFSAEHHLHATPPCWISQTNCNKAVKWLKFG